MISVIIISKDEPSLDATLTDVDRQINSLMQPGEIVVIDASSTRLDYIRQRHEGTVRWLDFEPPPGIGVSIPHQRNVGVRAARGDVIVFIDAGCRPQAGWLDHLVAPLHKESIVAGVARDTTGDSPYKLAYQNVNEVTYLRECATINLAFHRKVFNEVGGFDESFAYGSDVDFTWRLNDMGYRICCAEDAVVQHDYGTRRRQRHRSFMYGKARARLYRKHRARRRDILRNDPTVIAYPLFLLGLPLTLVFPLYPLLLLIPVWRNRSRNGIQVVIDHLWFGTGVLAELTVS